MTGRKNRALQVPYVLPYKALGNFSKALYGTTGGTWSARFFHPVMILPDWWGCIAFLFDVMGKVNLLINLFIYLFPLNPRQWNKVLARILWVAVQCQIKSQRAYPTSEVCGHFPRNVWKVEAFLVHFPRSSARKFYASIRLEKWCIVYFVQKN